MRLKPMMSPEGVYCGKCDSGCGKTARYGIIIAPSNSIQNRTTTIMGETREQYTMGYGPSAVGIMGLRTAQNHAAFLLPFLRPGMKLLDCGCGPGTITAGFAQVLAPGEVIGTDLEESQVEIASGNAASQGVHNASFQTADIYNLPFDSEMFDAVFTSAVLGNLRDPLKGIRELHRVLKPGGVIGVKEFDHGGDIAYPLEPAIRKYTELYLRLRHDNGHDGEAGRKIGTYLAKAGFRDLRLSACYESLSGTEMLTGAAQLNIGLLRDGWAAAFIERGWTNQEEIEAMSSAWLNFARTPGSLLAFTWCEALAIK